MSGDNSLAARAAKVGGRAGRGAGVPPAGGKTSTAGSRSAPRTKPVRTTIDLEPKDHKMLAKYCRDLAGTLDRSKVYQADVFRELLSQLAADPALRARVEVGVEARMDARDDPGPGAVMQ